MRWHAERVKPDDRDESKLRHLADASQWRALNAEFDFFSQMIQGTSCLALVVMAWIHLATRTPIIAHGPCLYGCTTPLVVHEGKIHTHGYAYSRVQTTGKWYKSVSRVSERGATYLMENTGQDIGCKQRRVFLHESRADHDGAGVSRLRLSIRPGVPQILWMHEVHGWYNFFVAIERWRVFENRVHGASKMAREGWPMEKAWRSIQW